MKKMMMGLLFCCMTQTAYAEDVPVPSLFFTSEETRQVEALAVTANHPETAPGDIQLGAVFYYAPDNWVLWMQGKKFTPQTHRSDIDIVSVTPDEVRFNYRPELGDSPRDITLKPHQVFQLSTGKVVEASSSTVALSK
jgi:hypothetical protein